MALRQRARILSRELVRATRQKDVGRALGRGKQALLAFGVAVDRAHQLALGGERHLAETREADVERFHLQPRLAGGDD